ncbi:hypothetical protein BD769DRAFT_1576251 [Suillus cothurnatus]|nr:hypothetical protein BD769DRAFT_1576251 [Suillus cothurnatus]
MRVVFFWQPPSLVPRLCARRLSLLQQKMTLRTYQERWATRDLLCLPGEHSLFLCFCRSILGSRSSFILEGNARGNYTAWWCLHWILYPRLDAPNQLSCVVTYSIDKYSRSTRAPAFCISSSRSFPPTPFLH